MSLQLGKELFDVTTNVDTSGTAPRAGAMPATPGPKSQSNSQSQTDPTTPALKASQSVTNNSQEIPDTPARSTGWDSAQQHQGLSYLVAQHQTSAILQVEAPVTGFLSIRPTGMHSETHRKLVRAVGQKHSKVARLRLAPETLPTSNGNKQNGGGAKKKSRASAGGASGSGGYSSRRRAASDDDDSDGGFERALREKRRGARSTYSGRNRASIKHDYSDDEDEDEGGAAGWGDDDDDDGHGVSSPRKRKPSQSKLKEKNPATGGDYQADDFLVEDTPSEAEDEDGEGSRRRKRSNRVEEDGEEPDLLDKIDRDIEEQARKKRKETSGGAAARPLTIVDDDDLESEGMDISDSERKPAKTNSAGAGSTLLAEDRDDEDDGIPQTSRKPGKKRIIIEDDEDE